MQRTWGLWGCTLLLLLSGSDGLQPRGWSLRRAGLVQGHRRLRTVVMQLPLKTWKDYIQPDDPRLFEDIPPDYKPDMSHPGTLKPGTVPENSPFYDLPKEIPHRTPNFQEVPFHIRWPAPHPASQPIIDWLGDMGHLMSDEEEEELEKRSARARARAAPKKSTKMLSPSQIDDELLDDSEAVLEEALTEEAPPPPKKRGRKPKAAAVEEAEEDIVDAESVGGLFDSTSMDDEPELLSGDFSGGGGDF